MSEMTFTTYFKKKEIYLNRLMDEKVERFIENKTKPKKSFFGKVTKMSREDAVKSLDEDFDDDDDWLSLAGTNREILLYGLKLDLKRLQTLYSMVQSSVDKRIFLTQRDYEFLAKVN